MLNRDSFGVIFGICIADASFSTIHRCVQIRLNYPLYVLCLPKFSTTTVARPWWVLCRIFLTFRLGCIFFIFQGSVLLSMRVFFEHDAHGKNGRNPHTINVCRCLSTYNNSYSVLHINL